MSLDSESETPLTCHACGHSVAVADEFCSHCWAPLSNETPPAESAASEQGLQPQKTSEDPPSGPASIRAEQFDNEEPIAAQHALSDTDDNPDSIIDAELSQSAQPVSAVAMRPVIDGDSIADAEIVVGNNEPNDQGLVKRSPFAPQNYRPEQGLSPPHKTQPPTENLAAKGGAVAAVTLGVMALPGALLTPASAITAMLGIGLGMWGLLSKHRRSAIIGIVLCAVALLLCMLRDQLGLS